MSKKRSNTRFIMGIAVAVLLPLSFYIITKALKKDKIDMPGFYIADRVDTKEVEGKMVNDTVFHRVNDLVLVNQLGKQVSINNDLKDKILVINFFFTSCPTICPKLTGNMKMLQRAFKKDPKKEFVIGNEIQFLSLTVNPERDSFQVLRAYADQYDIDHDRWWLLTGDKQTIYQFARGELRVSVQPSEGGAEDFIHTEKIVVLDQDRYIRGYYDGLDTADIKRCADDIVLLTMQKRHKK